MEVGLAGGDDLKWPVNKDGHCCHDIRQHSLQSAQSGTQRDQTGPNSNSNLDTVTRACSANPTVIPPTLPNAAIEDISKPRKVPPRHTVKLQSVNRAALPHSPLRDGLQGIMSSHGQRAAMEGSKHGQWAAVIVSGERKQSWAAMDGINGHNSPRKVEQSSGFETVFARCFSK